MSQCNITFDTLTKELVVTIDGKKIKDIVGIAIQSYTEEDGAIRGFLEIITSKYDEENKSGVMTKIHATKRINFPKYQLNDIQVGDIDTARLDDDNGAAIDQLIHYFESVL